MTATTSYCYAAESRRVLSHLKRCRNTFHAAGGMGLTLAQTAEMAHVLVLRRPSRIGTPIMWACVVPFALGTTTRHMRKRVERNNRTHLPSVTGLLWVSSFLALARAAKESGGRGGPLPRSRVFEVLLACSAGSTVAEIVHPSVTRGNGWIFGVVFTYATLLFPWCLDRALAPETVARLYDGNRMATVIYYNCVHNSLFVSLSFFVLSIRDSKIVGENFCDVVGRLLWTCPQIPLCYVAVWRLSSFEHANAWLTATSVLAGAIMLLQKRGWFVSTLKKSRPTTKAT